MDQPRSEFSLSHVPELSATRLTLREQAASWWMYLHYTIRRLLRRERRVYLTLPSGRVAAKFTSHEHAQVFLAWLGSTHAATYAHGESDGRNRAQQHADPG